MLKTTPHIFSICLLFLAHNLTWFWSKKNPQDTPIGVTNAPSPRKSYFLLKQRHGFFIADNQVCWSEKVPGSGSRWKTLNPHPPPKVVFSPPNTLIRLNIIPILLADKLFWFWSQNVQQMLTHTPNPPLMPKTPPLVSQMPSPPKNRFFFTKRASVFLLPIVKCDFDQKRCQALAQAEKPSTPTPESRFLSSKRAYNTEHFSDFACR